MSEEKDTSVIPEGPYCYVPDIEKNANKAEDDHTYYTKTCPYFKYKKDEGVDVVHCEFLNVSGLINGTSSEDYAKLKKKYGGSKEMWDKYPADLLWDQVKSCGENDEWE
jgi:hypothetical protein